LDPFVGILLPEVPSYESLRRGKGPSFRNRVSPMCKNYEPPKGEGCDLSAKIEIRALGRDICLTSTVDGRAQVYDHNVPKQLRYRYFCVLQIQVDRNQGEKHEKIFFASLCKVNPNMCDSASLRLLVHWQLSPNCYEASSLGVLNFYINQAEAHRNLSWCTMGPQGLKRDVGVHPDLGSKL